MDAPSLIRQLSDPRAYPHAPERIDIIQTHGALVCLAGDLAYKVRKPVDLGFFDFSTLAKRRHFSEEEVRLNQPLASRVYLAVVPITHADGALRVEGEGEPVEFAVKMRRLPAERMLDALIEAGRADADLMRRIARTLTRFHDGAERSDEIDRAGAPEAVRARILENLEQCAASAGDADALPSDDGPTVDRRALGAVRAAAERFIDAHRRLLLRRIREGRIVDGHGDVHCGNVCLSPELSDDGLVIYDRIEFSAAFRRADRAADCAFLAMDLASRARRDLAGAFVGACAELSGDDELPELLRLYIPHFACVRGKVEAIRSREAEVSEDHRRAARLRSMRFFALAAFEARSPFLIVTSGLPASGKSTLSRALHSLTGADWIRTDEVRKRLHGAPPTDRLPQSAYSDDATRRTYDEALRLAREALHAGRSAILDGAFPSAALRGGALAVAGAAAAPACIVHTFVDDVEAEKRIAARTARADDPSDADGRVRALMRERFEPPQPSEGPVAHIDGARPVDLALALVAGAMR